MGTISGLDGIRFLRGTLRWLAGERGLGAFLEPCEDFVRIFPVRVNGLTAQVRTRLNRERRFGNRVR